MRTRRGVRNTKHFTDVQQGRKPLRTTNEPGGDDGALGIEGKTDDFCRVAT